MYPQAFKEPIMFISHTRLIIILGGNRGLVLAWKLWRTILIKKQVPFKLILGALCWAHIFSKACVVFFWNEKLFQGLTTKSESWQRREVLVTIPWALLILFFQSQEQVAIFSHICVQYIHIAISSLQFFTKHNESSSKEIFEAEFAHHWQDTSNVQLRLKKNLELSGEISTNYAVSTMR